MSQRATLYCDGASRGNPGSASYGFVIYDGDQILAQGNGTLGNATNNYAEYQGLIKGLSRCIALGLKEITIRADSELMVRQLNGHYRVKSVVLRPLFTEAKALLGKLTSVKIEHVRREQNKTADLLANQALDGALLPNQ